MGDYEAGRDSFRFNPGGGRDTIQGSGGDRLEIASAATSAAIESADGIPFIFRGFDATGAEIERIEITGAALFDSLILCKFLRGVFADVWAEGAELLGAVTGWDVTADELRTVARRVVTAKKKS